MEKIHIERLIERRIHEAYINRASMQEVMAVIEELRLLQKFIKEME